MSKHQGIPEQGYCWQERGLGFRDLRVGGGGPTVSSQTLPSRC